MTSLKQQYLGFLSGNSLWNSETLFGLSQFNFEELSKEVARPNTISVTIPDNEVLGKRIEFFFEYCIETSKSYEVIAKNLQVFKEKITIGELDFLIRDLQNDKVIHIELIYKFYLYDPSMSQELDRWIGPNRKDSLLQKVDKLKNKQLPLLFRDETTPILESFNLRASTINQQVCFLANLFIPYLHRDESLPHLNKNCIVGYWMRLEEFIVEEHTSLLFYIPKKQDWVVKPKYNEMWFSFEDICNEVQLYLSQKKSPLVWVKTNEDSYKKLFIIWW